MKQEPFVIERSFNAPIEKVWKAITDRDQMKQWYFDIAGFKPEVGYEFEFEGGDENKRYRHMCKITEVIPGKKLSYSWRYDGYEGNSLVTFELFAEGNQTKLKLTHAGLETFPRTNPDLAKENFAAGWNEIIGTALKNFIETTSIKRSIEINASALKVWQVLVNTDYIKQWASAFSEGTYVETDWKKGSEVLWKTKEGEVGAKGVVEINDAASLLKVVFYEDTNSDRSATPGPYSEVYSLSGSENKTILSVEAGPLSFKDNAVHAPLWDKAIAKIKTLSES